MIKLIIPSKNRACQLHLLLESIERNFPYFNTTVLFKSTDEDYLCGYSKTMEYFPNVDFTFESQFRYDLTHFIKTAKEDFIAIACDDNVIYRKESLPSSFKVEAGECFSLRLGLNTIVQDCHKNTMQSPLDKRIVKNGTLYWNSAFYHPFSNYGYPFSLDFHVYNKNFFLQLIQQFSWNNTNELESGLTRYREQCLYMRSFSESISVNIPMNNMSNITRHGEKHGYSISYLNTEYIEGNRINLDKIMLEKVIGAHQEMSLEFIK